MQILKTSKLNLLKRCGIFSLALWAAVTLITPSALWAKVAFALSFPILAYYYTALCLSPAFSGRDLLRLFVLSVILQPLYLCLAYPGAFSEHLFHLNPFFTLTAGALCIYGFHRRNWGCLAIGIIASITLQTSFGLGGVILMLVFYMFRGHKTGGFFICFILLGSLFFTGILNQAPTLSSSGLSFPRPSFDFVFLGLPLDSRGFSVFALPLIWAVARSHLFSSPVNPFPCSQVE